MDEFKSLDLFEDSGPYTDDIVMEETEMDTQNVDMQEDKEVTSERYDDIVEEIKQEDIVQENEDVKEVNEIDNQQLCEIIRLTQEVSGKIDGLGALFDKRIMHTDYEEKILDQMHSELQKYKDDMYAQMLKPILMDIIEVRDSIIRMSATYKSKPEGEQDIPNKTFYDYTYDLQDILENNGVEIYRSEIGHAFNPLKQRIVKKITTEDETLHSKVAESLSSGYSYNGRVISPEKIMVYSYEKTENIENNNEKSEVIENG